MIALVCRKYSASYPTIQVEHCRLTLSKPTLKPSGTKRSKLEYHKSLSSFAFKLNLRRYIQPRITRTLLRALLDASKPLVGRCRLTLSNPS